MVLPEIGPIKKRLRSQVLLHVRTLPLAFLDGDDGAALLLGRTFPQTLTYQVEVDLDGSVVLFGFVVQEVQDSMDNVAVHL